MQYLSQRCKQIPKSTVFSVFTALANEHKAINLGQGFPAGRTADGGLLGVWSDPNRNRDHKLPPVLRRLRQQRDAWLPVPYLDLCGCGALLPCLLAVVWRFVVTRMRAHSCQMTNENFVDWDR